MKTIRRQAKRVGIAPSSTGAIAVLLTLSWCVQASGEPQARPPTQSVVAAKDQAAAARTARPEVWLCAGERIAELCRPDAEWPFVKQHLTGIKFYVGDRPNVLLIITDQRSGACMSCRMVRTDRYKYCVYSRGIRRESLVDMASDPGETTDLAGDPKYREVLLEHRQILARFDRKHNDPLVAELLADDVKPIPFAPAASTKAGDQ